MRNIKVEDDVWKTLMQMRLELNKKKVSDVVRDLLKHREDVKSFMNVEEKEAKP